MIAAYMELKCLFLKENGYSCCQVHILINFATKSAGDLLKDNTVSTKTSSKDAFAKFCLVELLFY